MNVTHLKDPIEVPLNYCQSFDELGKIPKKHLTMALLEKSVFFPLKIPKHLEKFQKIGVGNAKCHANCYKCWSYRTK